MCGCSVLLEEVDMGVTKFICECTTIPPLLELAARSLHCVLKGESDLLLYCYSNFWSVRMNWYNFSTDLTLSG